MFKMQNAECKIIREASLSILSAKRKVAELRCIYMVNFAIQVKLLRSEVSAKRN